MLKMVPALLGWIGEGNLLSMMTLHYFGRFGISVVCGLVVSVGHVKLLALVSYAGLIGTSDGAL